jgi:hypothetical protein
LRNFRNRIVIFLFISCFLSGSRPFEASSITEPIAKGAIFPDIIFAEILSKEARTYLDTQKKSNFSLKDTKGDIYIIEVFSTYCTSCPKNIQLLNSVYSLIAKDPGLKAKVKMMAIAVGNNQTEVNTFSREYKVLYPVLTDYRFNAHKALGNPYVPFTVFAKRDAKGRITVVETHRGLFGSKEEIMKIVRELLK